MFGEPPSSWKKRVKKSSKPPNYLNYTLSYSTGLVHRHTYKTSSGSHFIMLRASREDHSLEEGDSTVSEVSERGRLVEEDDDDDKVVNIHSQWKRYTKGMRLKRRDRDNVKTVMLLFLVVIVMLHVSQHQRSNNNSSSWLSSHTKSLRHHHHEEDHSEQERLYQAKRLDEKEDTYDPTEKHGMVPQYLLPGMMQSNSHAAHQAFFQQQQQQQLLQQQQNALWQAQAQKQMEDHLKAQQEVMRKQQEALLYHQQQQQNALWMQQQQALLAGLGGPGMYVGPQLAGMMYQGGMNMMNPYQGGMTNNAVIPQAVMGGFEQAAAGMQPEAVAAGGGVTAPAAPGAVAAGNTETSVAAGEGSVNPTEVGSTPQEGSRPSDTDMAKVAEEIPLVEMSNFADAWEPFNKAFIPMYWHIPKAGGSTVKDVIGACHRMTMATEFGITDGHDQDTEIAVVYPKAPGGVTDDRSPFVNVDVSTVAGIERAAKMGFADAGLAGCVVSPFLYEANSLFTPTAKGRLFAVFRDPVDRAISMFYYIQVATWEPSYRPDLQNWTLEQYATSDVIENNWMVRQLSNQLGGDLNESHLKKAMEMVRRKFMVGLMKRVEESMSRFERFFRWTYHVNPKNQEICRERLTKGGSNSNSKNKKNKPRPGDPVYDLVLAQNQYDMQLYQYVVTLFDEQEAFVQGIPANFRQINGTCCKCDPPEYPPEGFNCPKRVLNE